MLRRAPLVLWVILLWNGLSGYSRIRATPKILNSRDVLFLKNWSEVIVFPRGLHLTRYVRPGSVYLAKDWRGSWTNSQYAGRLASPYIASQLYAAFLQLAASQPHEGKHVLALSSVLFWEHPGLCLCNSKWTYLPAIMINVTGKLNGYPQVHC